MFLSDSRGLVRDIGEKLVEVTPRVPTGQSAVASE
jgi:hypothetical protein